MLKKITRSQKGFTLIEILVVVAILGILAAVIVPNVTGFIDQGRVAAAQAELAAVQTAADAYNSVEGTPLPAGAVDLTALSPYLRATPAATYTIDTDGKVTSP